MLLALAWKNIWRNKKRSFIIIAAITFGLWGGLFSSAIMVGMMESMVETAISRNLSHIQIHSKEYSQEKDIRSYIPDGLAVLEKTRTVPAVLAAAGRTKIIGMAASPTSSYGVEIIGIVADESKRVTDIYSKVIEGNYFEINRRNPILVGSKLADRLNLKLHSKVVLSFQNLEGGISYIAFRIVGISPPVLRSMTVSAPNSVAT